MYIRLGLINKRDVVFGYAGIAFDEKWILYYRSWSNDKTGREAVVIYFRDGWEVADENGNIKRVNDILVNITEERLSKMLTEKGLMIDLVD